jgi:hypothetical protein
MVSLAHVTLDFRKMCFSFLRPVFEFFRLRFWSRKDTSMPRGMTPQNIPVATTAPPTFQASQDINIAPEAPPKQDLVKQKTAEIPMSNSAAGPMVQPDREAKVTGAIPGTPAPETEKRPSLPVPTAVSATSATAPLAKPQNETPAQKPKTDKNGDAKSKPDALASAPGEAKLSGKELKEKKKAEKAARRLQTKAAAPPAAAQKQQLKTPTKGGKKGAAQDGPVSTIRLGAEKPGAKVTAPSKEVEPAVVVETARDRGLVGLLKDLELEQSEKKKKPVFGIDSAHPEVHPAILTLGMQINKRIVAGSTARCMGFLLAIKRVGNLSLEL